MPLQATSGAASYDAYGGGVAAIPNYIEDVFSTYLYTGNGSTQTITNGIDLSGKGGLVWTKNRAGTPTLYHALMDTNRGINSTLQSNSTDDATGGLAYSDITSFNSNGFSLGYVTSFSNENGNTYASWTFRKQPKFFDVLTYTGTGSNTTIAHSLGSVPGSIIVKRTDTAAAWAVYHRSLANTEYLVLNSTAAKATGATWWNSTTPTSAVFSVGTDASVNASGGTYVAYIFAHDAGGFGLTGTDNVISCGSFTTDSGGNATVTLGYEPAWLMFKCSSNAGQNWNMLDTMRGWSMSTDLHLEANSSVAEDPGGYGNPIATGFVMGGQGNTQTYIYIAIRRGPMKVPTLGTSVYNAIARTGTGAAATVTGVGFSPDLVITGHRTNPTFGFNKPAVDRLRGPKTKIYVDATASEGTTTDSFLSFNMDGFSLGADGSEGNWNENSATLINWNMRRAPGFFDEVCYAGTNTTGPSISHNLGAVPELMIVKNRTTATNNWWVYLATLGNTSRLLLNTDAAVGTGTDRWNSTSPTSSVFTVGTPAGATNGITSENFVAYLFATCAGVSKVGSYTGTGTTLQINCGFTAGARFVLIKRTDSTGDWYVWDSARGIVAGNDPYLLLNSTAAEVTSTDYVDTYSAGFEISSTAPAAINASAGSFIFLAIA